MDDLVKETEKNNNELSEFHDVFPISLKTDCTDDFIPQKNISSPCWSRIARRQTSNENLRQRNIVFFFISQTEPVIDFCFDAYPQSKHRISLL